jgi:hypothetical protein
MFPGARIAPMLDYHAYTLDETGHITGRVDLKCPNDEIAEVCARRLVNGCDVELWQLDRRVAVFRAKRAAATRRT